VGEGEAEGGRDVLFYDLVGHNRGRRNTMEQRYILLVEDNPDDVELTLLAFKKYNIKNDLVVIQDGAEALDYLFAEGAYAGRDLSNMPTVILLDLKLPKIGGLEVLRRIRADERTKFLPVVILTSSKEEQDLINGYKFGANSYVRKPIDFAQFTEAARQLGLYWLILNEPPPRKL
jgi:two-component system response regulator